MLANDLGMLSSSGIDMTVVEYVGSSEVVAAFRSGAAQMGQLSGVAAIRLAAEGKPPVKIFWANLIQNPGIVLVAKSSIESIEELQGKRIGVTATGETDGGLRTLLRSHGVVPEEVQWISGNPTERADMLLEGKIDATLAAFQTYVVKLEDKSGFHVLIDEKEMNPSGRGFLVGISKSELIEEEPDVVAHITSSFLRAARLFSESPKAWVDAASKRRPDVPKEKIRRLWQRHSEEWPVNGGIDMKFFKKTINALNASGQLGSSVLEHPPVEDWVTNEFEQMALQELGEYHRQ